MNNQRKFKIVILFLSAALLTALGFIGFILVQISQWKGENGLLASEVGAKRAVGDYQAGKIRLFIILGENEKDKFSGTNNGPYEIWISHYFPESPYPNRYSIEKEVAFYNAIMKMRYEQGQFLQRKGVVTTNELPAQN